MLSSYDDSDLALTRKAILTQATAWMDMDGHASHGRTGRI